METTAAGGTTAPEITPRRDPLAPLRRTWVELRHTARLAAARCYRPVPAMRALAGSGRGRRCFVIGNGPSLNRTNLSLLADEDTFAVNGIFLKFHELPFRPTYYVVEDELVAEDRANTINALEGMTKLFPRFLGRWLRPGPDTLFLNVVRDYLPYSGFPEFSTDAARCLWVGGTVTYLNLQLAFHMGYDPVILVGVDCDYRVDAGEVEADGTKLTSTADDHNHFHPDYFGKGYRFHEPMVERMLTAYWRARDVYEAHGRRIWNATRGGKLEVFERVDYDSLF